MTTDRYVTNRNKDLALIDQDLISREANTVRCSSSTQDLE